jgi:shikimate dehydrogenase
VSTSAGSSSGRLCWTSTWSSVPSPPRGGQARRTVAATPLLLDAIYDPWPTPLAAAVEAAGGQVISGLQMLLHQAFAQVEQFTGLPAPAEAMRVALAEQ